MLSALKVVKVASTPEQCELASPTKKKWCRERRKRQRCGRGRRSGFEIEGTDRDLEGRASRSITERESRGRDEDGRGGSGYS